MRIGFLDPSLYQFTVDTPYQSPLGGSHSALCYLAEELARLGHSVTIFNGVANPAESRGVEVRNYNEIQTSGLNTFDVAVVLNAPVGRILRRDARVNIPLILWNQHSYDQPAILALKRLDECKRWSAFAFVSDWQSKHFEETFWVPREKIRVMRNAVAPAFAKAEPKEPWFLTGEPPVLFYSSTPFRGLDVLLQAFPAIRASLPGTQLRIYSSMGTYQVRAEEDPYRDLYSQAQQMEGVEYMGSVGQSRLVQDLAGAGALAYPSTFAETSCIAVLEAMALGAAILTTRLGALPETTGGFGHMVDWQADKTQLADSYAKMAIATLLNMKSDPAAATVRRNEQIKFIQDNYLWPNRAREWADWLGQIVSGK